MLSNWLITKLRCESASWVAMSAPCLRMPRLIVSNLQQFHEPLGLGHHPDPVRRLRMLARLRGTLRLSRPGAVCALYRGVVAVVEVEVAVVWTDLSDIAM